MEKEYANKIVPEDNKKEIKAIILEKKNKEIVEKNKINKEERIEEDYILQGAKPYKNKKITWCITIIIVLIIIAIISMGFALVNSGNENIVAGVKIDEINVQGLKKVEALKIIRNKIEEKKDTPLKIKIGDEEYSILPSQIETEYDEETAVEEANKIGRRSNIFGNNFEIVKSRLFGKNIIIKFTYNEDLLNNVINEIISKIPNGVIQPTYCIEEENLIITKGIKGLSVNKEELKSKIEKQLNLNESAVIEIEAKDTMPEDIDIDKIYKEVHAEVQDAYYTTNPFTVVAEVKGIDFNLDEAKEALKEDKDEYIIPLTITNPKKNINDIGTEAFPDLLGSCNTRYDASNAPRSTNLKVAVQKINGVVIMPGETFSYNKTLGKRTAEAGYKDAAGYEGGKVVQMIGGGICQISSTLYDAVVYANLEITERHNHVFLTSYIGAGKDATVVYGSLDFQFKNTRKYPVKIKASANNGIAKVEIFGIKEESEYDVEISSTILNYITYKTIYENDASLGKGQEKVTQNGMNGCKSITYKILKSNGVEVSRQVLSTDTYEPMNKYVSVGTKVTTQTVAPVEPETPANPENPETPGETETPQEPETPEEPQEQEVPGTPETPSTEPETPNETEP